MSSAPDVSTATARPAARTAPTADELRQAYRVAVRSRALEEHIVRLVTRGEVKFAIWGVGEEVHGTATALALSKRGRAARGCRHFGVVPHYRSGALCLAVVRAARRHRLHAAGPAPAVLEGTDTMSGGRQMVYHLHLPEVGVLPVQSPVGMQLGKAAGYALGSASRWASPMALTMGIVGDGTTAEGDMHDAMNA
jgi:2-oxoisovalerate dehydrogenase E1 component